MPCSKARPLVITWWLGISCFKESDHAHQRASLSAAFDGRPYRPDGLPVRMAGSMPRAASTADPYLGPSAGAFADGRSAQPPITAPAVAMNRYNDFIDDLPTCGLLTPSRQLF